MAGNSAEDKNKAFDNILIGESGCGDGGGSATEFDCNCISPSQITDDEKKGNSLSREIEVIAEDDEQCKTNNAIVTASAPPISLLQQDEHHDGGDVEEQRKVSPIRRFARRVSGCEIKCRLHREVSSRLPANYT